MIASTCIHVVIPSLHLVESTNYFIRGSKIPKTSVYILG